MEFEEDLTMLAEATTYLVDNMFVILRSPI